MFKKHAYYLSLCLLAAPLVASAENELADPVDPLPLALQQLPIDCPGLKPVPDASALALLQAFYQQQDNVQVWSVSDRVPALQAQFQHLADDGLDPSRYSLPGEQAVGGPLCTDIGISLRYLQALRELRYGRLQQSRFEPMWYAQPPLDTRNVQLLAIAGPGLQDLAGAFDAARPVSEQYRSLQKVYSAQRTQPLPHWPVLPTGSLLRPGMQDARVPGLAQRLFSEGYLASLPAHGATDYTEPLVDAVKHFQLNHSLQADGVVGAGTLVELNVSPHVRREQLRVNLERFRWLAQDMEPDSLLVNIAAAQLTVFQGGVPVWQTRTQVGRAERQTPLLKSRVTRLTLNPTWTVPPTIMREDKLPQIRRDQTFLSRQNLQVLDHNGNRLDINQIDWDSPGNILLRQDAGPRNPLGQMAVRFPNPFSVYLHDTPSQALFQKGPRAFSSGCVRVEHALQLRDLLVSPTERLRTNELLATGVTHEFRLAVPIPIMLTYWTVQADSHGRLLYAPDIYGRDPVLINAMGIKS
ncbi:MULTISPECIES: murein L,D-transpeptidase [unclassified Pseudomonas]|uniref:L,D-transpeptidase family protein n=1 Tax=unclassified Pseudomonas TaxID=196821 RepID=UPI000B893A8E|nr:MULTISPECIES: L,D-transpeptidase family protein [unclassified Pseudomonas]